MTPTVLGYHSAVVGSPYHCVVCIADKLLARIVGVAHKDSAGKDTDSVLAIDAAGYAVDADAVVIDGGYHACHV